MLIRPFEIADNSECCDLIEASFAEFIEPGFGKAGKQTFRTHIQKEREREKLPDDTFGFVAQDGNDIAGVVLVCRNTHIQWLFVDKRWHRQSIARKLMDAAVAQVTRRSPDARVITVKSSLYAVDVYRSLDFIDAGEQITEKGIIAVPLRLHI